MRPFWKARIHYSLWSPPHWENVLDPRILQRQVRLLLHRVIWSKQRRTVEPFLPKDCGILQKFRPDREFLGRGVHLATKLFSQHQRATYNSLYRRTPLAGHPPFQILECIRIFLEQLGFPTRQSQTNRMWIRNFVDDQQATRQQGGSPQSRYKKNSSFSLHP